MDNSWTKPFECHRVSWHSALLWMLRLSVIVLGLWICVSSPFRVIFFLFLWCKSAVVYVCPSDAQYECVYVCMCPSFAQMSKTLFVRHLETRRGRLYKIPACWSNGTVGKATIVIPTMKRLSSMALREKCSQFVFCLSRFLTLGVTFPSSCPYILPLCPLSLVPTSTLR